MSRTKRISNVWSNLENFERLINHERLTRKKGDFFPSQIYSLLLSHALIHPGGLISERIAHSEILNVLS